MVRKVPKFHGASANGFWQRSEKPPGGDSAPPLVKRPSETTKVTFW